MLPGPARHLAPVRLVSCVGLGRQNARAGVCRPTRMPGIDDRDLRAAGGELVRHREADEASAGDGDVGVGAYDAFSGVAAGAALRASGAGGVGAASSAFSAASSVSTEASLPTASNSF